MYVIFLIQPDWGAANVTPCHKGGCIGARSEGWRVHHSIASDSPWLLCLHACLAPLCLQGGINFLECVWMTPLWGVRRQGIQLNMPYLSGTTMTCRVVLLSQQTWMSQAHMTNDHMTMQLHMSVLVWSSTAAMLHRDMSSHGNHCPISICTHT